MQNVRLLVEYDGTDFHGFARQQNVRTVQGVLETTLQSMLKETVEVFGASRTDAGVHARGQVVNFFTSRPVPLAVLPSAMNRRLAPDLRVIRADRVPERFHARFSAYSRVYRYSVYTAQHPSVWRIRYAWHYPRALSVERMAEALQRLEGEHDFRAFSVKTPEEKNTVRTLYRTAVRSVRDGVQIELEANGFLRGMVRLIVGALLVVGEGKLPSEALRTALEERVQQTRMAPPQGLCLMRVKYRPPKTGRLAPP
ncbi:MAG: tRNA pseudouridine(38-40) synthase TruA [Fimbriimonadales bacterium]